LIPWIVVHDGITGGSNLVRPFNILLFFFSLAYMAMSLGIHFHLQSMIVLTGVLEAVAFWVSNRGGTSGRRLYLYFYLMTTALSAVLPVGNDPVILSGTVYFTKIAEVYHVAWIFSEFVTCNTASMLLFVGTIPYNLTNSRQPNEPGAM
jgi:Na+/H+ antiporter NhaD/arsenite permease-like protein